MLRKRKEKRTEVLPRHEVSLLVNMNRLTSGGNTRGIPKSTILDWLLTSGWRDLDDRGGFRPLVGMCKTVAPSRKPIKSEVTGGRGAWGEGGGPFSRMGTMGPRGIRLGRGGGEEEDRCARPRSWPTTSSPRQDRETAASASVGCIGWPYCAQDLKFLQLDPLFSGSGRGTT
jgi:hypothetical protein